MRPDRHLAAKQSGGATRRSFLPWGLSAGGVLVVSGLSGWNTSAVAQISNKAKAGTDKTQEIKVQPMTLQQEEDLGREMAAKIIANFHLYSNEPLTRYVNLVGATVAEQSERQDIKYHFAVLDSDGTNVFSAPGGFVFITRGALARCEDESELAGVLAHYVGHISGKHVVHSIERAKVLQAAMGEASAYVPGSDYLQKFSKNILVKLFDQGLARDDEFDADARGVTYAHAAGYPADGLERFLLALDRTADQSGHFFWLGMYPTVKERSDRLRQLISARHWEDTDRPRLAERFALAKATLPKPKAAP